MYPGSGFVPDCACVRNMLKYVTAEICVFQFVFRCFPLHPRCPVDSEMLLHTYTTYVKGVVGLVGGGRAVQANEDTRQLTIISQFAYDRFYCTSTV